jgi:hypothetical protein
VIRTLAGCAAAAMALCACAQMSAGDCTDKGTCDWADAEAARDGTGGQEIDATLDVTSAADAPRDAVWPDGAVGLDAPVDRADATVDASEAGDSGDASEAGDSGDASEAGDSSDASDAGGSGDASDASDTADVVSAGCTCVASVPSGWSGPIALAEATGAPPASIAPCAAPYGATAYDGNADPSAPAAQCDCTCGGATSVQCAAPVVDLFSDSACSSACASAPVTPGVCAGVSTAGCGAAVYARARAPMMSGGSCAPQPTSKVPPMQWERVARACALPAPATQGGCEGSFVCAPAPSPPFSGHLCVAMTGDQSCPNGSAYAVRHVYYGGATDGRGCSTCACGAPGGGSCSGSFTTYNASGCALETKTFLLSPTCDSVQIATASVEATVAGPGDSGCAPSMVQATGALVPTQPTTVCCLP